MKKVTLSVFCVFSAVIIFFGVFGGMIRQSIYAPVTTAKVEMNVIEGSDKIVRSVPAGAVHTDGGGNSYVWVVTEADDIGEKYHFATKVFVEITLRGEKYTAIGGVPNGTAVIVTAAAEIQNGTRVKISGEYSEDYN